MPEVTVIVPCYNQGQYIDEAVDSVLNQTFQDFEIIIINDGSSDEYTNIKLKDYRKPKTKVIHTNNQGVSAARNHAIKESRGKYILPLDADDKINERFLEKAIKALESDKKNILVYSQVEFFGERTGKWHLDEFDIKKMLLTNQIVCTALYKKEDFFKTNGYDSDFKTGLEDWDFWLSLLELEGNVVRLPDRLFYYRIKKGSRNSSIDDKQLNDLHYKIFIKHYKLYSQYYPAPTFAYKQNKILEDKLLILRNSKAYKIGSYISKSIKYIRNFFGLNNK